MHWAIIGRGRLGRTLAALLPQTGRTITLLGRDEPVPIGIETVMLCVPDDQIAACAARLDIGPIVLHCSGATSLEALAPHARAGSWHPLMTFPGPDVVIPDLVGVPVAVAGQHEAIATALLLARDLGMEPFEVPGDRRLYHAAAVMAGNFATLLVAEAADVMVAAGVDRDRAVNLLIPLVLRSVNSARYPISKALTGPIARGDEATIDSHRAAFADHGLEGAAAIYDTFVKQAHRRLSRPTETGGTDHTDSDSSCTAPRRC